MSRSRSSSSSSSRRRSRACLEASTIEPVGEARRRQPQANSLVLAARGQQVAVARKRQPLRAVGKNSSQTLHPPPSTLHPTPYTPSSTPYPLHPTPQTLHPTPSTLNPAIGWKEFFAKPYALHPAPCTLHPKVSPTHAPDARGTRASRRPQLRLRPLPRSHWIPDTVVTHLLQGTLIYSKEHSFTPRNTHLLQGRVIYSKEESLNYSHAYLTY